MSEKPKPGHKKWRHPETPDHGIHYREHDYAQLWYGNPTGKAKFDAKVPAIRKAFLEYGQTEGMLAIYVATRDLIKELGMSEAEAHVIRDAFIQAVQGQSMNYSSDGKFRVRPRKQMEARIDHKKEQDTAVKKINAWADKNGVKCTCGARSYGDTQNHSSVCKAFKGYYKDWPRKDEGRAQRLVATLIG